MTIIDLTPAATVFLQFGALAVGMASWLDDEGSGDSGGGGGGGGEGGDFDVDDDFDDDFDDEFGSFDDMDGGGGGAGGADASVNELENRIEELETEVSNVASKANTVRSENEQISESVEDVEENVRKLLEIYEMVTRGVNPFVDDVDPNAAGGGPGADDQSFGLFDEDEGDEAAGDDLDADVADAEAEEFFEDDAFDDDFEDGEEAEAMDGFEDFEEDSELDEDDDEAEVMDGFEDDEGMMGEDFEEEGEEAAGDGGGTSFEELKEEYESGDADWAEGEAPEDGDDGIEAEDKPDIGFDDSDLEAEADDTAEPEPDAVEPEPEPSIDEASGAAPGPGLAIGGGDGPHLAEPPKGYLADVVCLEWLDHLLTEFGPKNTVRTINYYERIGWIGEPVRDQLFDFLEGLTDSDYLYREEFGSTELSMDDHLESLDYIEELASEDIERVIVDRCEDLHRNGIQR